jgi:hypothetical protein
MLPVRHLLGAAFSLLAVASATLHAAESALLWDGLNADLFSDDDGPFTIGFQFRPQTDIRVTALGSFDHLGDGFIDSHSIGIWTVGNESPLIIATVPAGAGTSLVGAFRYVEIDGFTLTANTDYIVAASGLYGSVRDLYAGSISILDYSASPGIRFEGSRGAAEGPGLNYPSGFREPLSPTTFGANFQFETIPEPSTWILLMLGGGLLATACLRSRHQDPQSGR